MNPSLTELLKEFRQEHGNGKMIWTSIEPFITRAYELGVAEERARILKGLPEKSDDVDDFGGIAHQLGFNQCRAEIVRLLEGEKST